MTCPGPLIHPFDAGRGPILVSAEITKPARTMPLQLLLDTGATTTLVDRSVLLALGFDLDACSDLAKMTTGSAIELVPRIPLTRLSALGQHRFGFPVLAHTPPESARVYGLLGLDFLRGLELNLNFKTGRITLG